MKTLPTFETERLILRGVTRDDVPAYERNFVDYEVISELSAAVPWPYPDNAVGEFLEKLVWPRQGKDRWLWGIFLRSSPDELIGYVDLWRKGAPENRGFWLARRHWGKGLMTEAVVPVTDYTDVNQGRGASELQVTPGRLALGAVAPTPQRAHAD